MLAIDLRFCARVLGIEVLLPPPDANWRSGGEIVVDGTGGSGRFEVEDEGEEVMT